MRTFLTVVTLLSLCLLMGSCKINRNHLPEFLSNRTLSPWGAKIFEKAKVGDMTAFDDRGFGRRFKQLYNESDYSLLHVAATRHQLAFASKLIDTGIAVDIRGPGDNTPLMLAAGVNDVEMVELLIQKGANIGATNESGWSVVYGAAFSRANNALETLLVHGANPNVKDKFGYTPIFAAVDKDCLECAKSLLSRGVDLNLSRDYPLNRAVANRNYNLVKLLLENGADPEKRASDLKSSLDVAKAEGYKDILELLQHYQKPFNAH